jgi:hypothetical protein
MVIAATCTLTAGRRLLAGVLSGVLGGAGTSLCRPWGLRFIRASSPRYLPVKPSRMTLWRRARSLPARYKNPEFTADSDGYGSNGE